MLLEAFAKIRTRKKIENPENDAAADVDAATRTEGQREVARDRTEDAAENGQRLGRDRAVLLQREIGYLAGGQRLRFPPLEPTDREVNSRQARPGDQRFGRHVFELFAHDLDDLLLARVQRPVGSVPALAFERNPALSRRHHAGHAEPGARAQHGPRVAFAALARADLETLSVREHGQCEGQRGVVVEHLQVTQAQGFPGFAHAEAPTVIGHIEAVAGNRRRDRDGRLVRIAKADQLEVFARRVDDRRMVGATQVARFDRRGLAVGDQREARVGAADIRDQAVVFRLHYLVPGGK